MKLLTSITFRMVTGRDEKKLHGCISKLIVLVFLSKKCILIRDAYVAEKITAFTFFSAVENIRINLLTLMSA